MQRNKETPQVVCSTTWGISKDQHQHFNHNDIKRKPKYFHQLAQYPLASPIFIAIDWHSLNYFQRFHCICLLCDESSNNYDFSFCHNKEIWVIYAVEKKLQVAMKMARAIQLAGASKTVVIMLSNQLMRRKIYDKY